jgi:3-hydroxyethyl bacteriochlorophyllide a dehydrogenase
VASWCSLAFTQHDLKFAYAPAFMREARMRIAAEWKRRTYWPSANWCTPAACRLDGLITHTQPSTQAGSAYETAFGDASCLEMILDWSASA